ncbi:hypothetical protein OPIT5_06060 [Opitutaceae bacterium TAV5]|nr:hypothetical protein OPIT5_06060 [Opitutaceae bacterium TAV5]
MRSTTSSVDNLILKSVKATKHASTFSAKTFTHLGSPAAVRKALERLVKRGELRRVRRGFYDRPRSHPLLGQTAPDPMDLVRRIMQDSGAQWQVSGAYAANQLHLSDQVPAKIVILTNGISRKIQLDKLTLDFRRSAPRNLLGAGKPAGTVIQAIRHLRASGMTPALITQLRAQLDPTTKSDLVVLAPQLPAWMQPLVRQITAPVTT